MSSKVFRVIITIALFFTVVGCSSSESEETVPQQQDEIQNSLITKEGADLFTNIGCTACHSLNDDVIVGPGMSGISERAVNRVEGLSPKSYIYQSIVKPNEFVVEEFQSNLMPEYGNLLKEEEINTLVSYLLSLK